MKIRKSNVVWRIKSTKLQLDFAFYSRKFILHQFPEEEVKLSFLMKSISQKQSVIFTFKPYCWAIIKKIILIL